jgi:hypothetical protein
MTATDILTEARLRRIILAPNGSRLVVKYPGQVPLDFEQVLIRHKAALIALLTSTRHLAKQVLLNEFENLNGKQYGNIYRALAANISDPVCHAAFDHLGEAIKRTKWKPNPQKQ